MKVSFDFDSTLTRTDVQSYAKELIDSGIEVWVVTSRPNVYQNHWIVNGLKVKLENLDLFEVTDKLNIPRNKIHFTCYVNKAEFLKNKNFIWHLDDDEIEIEFIAENNACIGVHVDSNNWKEICNASLKRL